MSTNVIYSARRDGVVMIKKVIRVDMTALSRPQQAKEVFEGTDGLSLCYAGLVAEEMTSCFSYAWIRTGESLYSQGLTSYNEKLKWATLSRSSKQEEPMSLYEMGKWFESEHARELDRAKALLKRSAELGFVESQCAGAYGLLLSVTNLERFLWLGKAALNGKVFAASIFIGVVGCILFAKRRCSGCFSNWGVSRRARW